MYFLFAQIICRENKPARNGSRDALLWAAGLMKILFWMTVVSKQVLSVDLKPKPWDNHEETERENVGSADFEDVL
jgi:hypothetical protein